MIAADFTVQVYLALGHTDMRKSIDGLTLLVSQQLALNPLSGQLFAFANRSRTMVKVLYWDRNGFCLWQKRLEKERFRWPCSRAEVLVIDRRTLTWLLDGLEMEQKRAHKRLKYSRIF